jgi:hypothetical protein
MRLLNCSLSLLLFRLVCVFGSDSSQPTNLLRSPADTEQNATELFEPSSQGRQLQSREVIAVHIVGERNSGTNWLEEVIKANFRPRVTNVFCQYKHWFQPPCQKPGPMIVAILVRNPYDWSVFFSFFFF